MQTAIRASQLSFLIGWASIGRLQSLPVKPVIIVGMLHAKTPFAFIVHLTGEEYW
jgi:hypothetical protein